MAINESTISLAISTYIKGVNPDRSTENDTEMVNFSNELASIIADAIKSADLTIATGLVNVTGTAAAQSNPAPIIVNGGLS